MGKSDTKPPKIAERFLKWVLKDDLLEEVLGDLDEKFFLTIKKKSLAKARINYWLQVLHYLRPFAIRGYKPKNSNNSAMIQHNLKLTYRNFLRYKSSFLINLIGLSSGLACTFLIYLWSADELSIDAFHEKDDRLYQVMQNIQKPTEMLTFEWTPSRLSKALAEEMPEVEYAVPVFPPAAYTFSGIISTDANNIKAAAKYVGEDYFNVFSYPLKRGNVDRVLKDKNAVIVSQELALSLFNTLDVVGKSVLWDMGEMTGEYFISGVLETLPRNSTIQFDILFNHDLYVSKNPDLDQWTYNAPCTYVALHKGTDIEDFTKKIEGLLSTKDQDAKGVLFTRKYSDQYLYGNYENGQVAGGRISYVILLMNIAAFILVIACINFMNLSTARASRRLKEIGVKKTIGARRGALMSQYLGESLIMSLLSALLAIIIVYSLLPLFNQITDKQISLILDTENVLSILAIVLITGLVSGSYPALYLSNFKPIAILKGRLSTSKNSLWVRKGLVTFQFTISTVLIVLVMVVYQQITFIQSKNLGYNKDNVIAFDANQFRDNELNVFMIKLGNMPGVISTSSMRGDLIRGEHNKTSNLQWEGQLEGQIVDFTDMVVEYNFFKTLGMELIDGRPFSQDLSNERDKIIFNETAIKAMGIEDPVGKIISLWNSERQIIGIVKDFHFESLYEEVRPCFFRIEDRTHTVLAKIANGREQETIEAVQKLYSDQQGGLAFDYQFLDSDYATIYASEQRISKLSWYFAGAAIIISCLGLLGLAAFTAETRIKEIGIRKILGSSIGQVVLLLSSGFTKTVMVAIVVAMPLSYWLAQNWLQSFAYRIEIEWWFFAIAGLAAMVVSWLTISLQTLKAARVNPVNCLKEE